MAHCVLRLWFKKGRTTITRSGYKKMNTANKINRATNPFPIPTQPTKGQPKRSISGVQFKAVQKAVQSVVQDAVPESTTQAVTMTAVYGIKPGQRAELLLQVESEKIVDARHVELHLVDGGNRRYVWVGTTGQAARLSPGNVVLMKASAISQRNDGMLIKHCRVIEVGE